MNNIIKGKIGEKFTVRYLKKLKYKVLAVNMRNRYSEIDIIAENKEYIIFVEVKTRSSDQQIRPADAVNRKKQQKIMTAAKHYLLYEYKDQSKQPRFDIAEVFLNEKNKPYSINYIENAFIQGGSYALL